jgi:non-heme chloroperoxidase
MLLVRRWLCLTASIFGGWPEKLRSSAATPDLTAIALQQRQSLLSIRRLSSLNLHCAYANGLRRQGMPWNSSIRRLATRSRRSIFSTAFMYAISATLRFASATGDEASIPSYSTQRINVMTSITTQDGVKLFYKDWGSKSAQPIVFHHGWPLSSDDWDNQMLFFVGKGFRVIAHDRRGHGRSSQASEGHNMDQYAADVAAMVKHLDLRNSIHIGHSTGGGEAARYVARHGKERVSKLVLIAAVTPLILRGANNPHGLPLDAFDGLRKELAGNRSQFYLDFASGPFYGYNRPNSKPSQAVIWNWWRQGMMGGAKAQYDCIKAFSETDFTEDLKSIAAPTLVMHGDDDQIVPINTSAPFSAKLLQTSTLKIYENLPHGMCTTHADVINAEILTFITT